MTQRYGYGMSVFVLGAGIIAAASAFAALSGERDLQAGGGSPYPSRYGDYFEVTARDGMLVGGEGRTGDSMRYRGKNVWTGPGTATVLVRERNNTGIVTGHVRTNGHTYTVFMNQFRGDRPYQSGGIASFVNLHGLTKHGEAILPKTFAYVAGWGGPCRVWKDADILYDGFECHFMLTEEVRDPETGEVPDFPDRREVRQVLRGQRWQGDYEENQEIKERIRESGTADRTGLQLHLFAHSSKRNMANVPPYETVMHFVWNDVDWWSGPRRPAAGTEGQPDRDIKRAIRRELKSNAMIDPRDVEVTVKDGRVTLSGRVDSRRAKRAAEDVAMQFEGVSEVKNRLKVAETQGEPQGLDAIVLFDAEPVQPGIARADRKLQRAIESELSWSPYVDADRVDVTVRDGVAYLFGSVEDRDEMQAAIDNAFQAGAERVMNRLAIVQPDAVDREG